MGPGLGMGQVALSRELAQSCRCSDYGIMPTDVIKGASLVWPAVFSAAFPYELLSLPRSPAQFQRFLKAKRLRPRPRRVQRLAATLAAPARVAIPVALALEILSRSPRVTNGPWTSSRIGPYFSRARSCSVRGFVPLPEF